MPLFPDSFRISFVLATLALTACLGYFCLHLQVDGENRSMDADNQEQEIVDNEFHEIFGKSDQILVAVEKLDVLDEAGRILIRELTDEFLTIEGVQSVSSLADNHFQVSSYHKNWAISETDSMTALTLNLEDFDDNGDSLAHAIEEVRRIVGNRQSDSVTLYVTGLPLQKLEAGRMVRHDQKIFAPLALVILGLVLFYITRRRSGMILPLVVSGLSVCWTLGIYSLAGHSLNMITSLLPPVIMTLSTTTTIHVYLEWLCGESSDSSTRIADALRKVWRPCLFASLTTVIGFLSLLVSHVPAVRLFGIFASVGVGISFFLGTVGIAVGLSFLAPPAATEVADDTKRNWIARTLEKTSLVAIKHPIGVLIVAATFSGIAFLGLTRVESNTDILRFLGDDTRLFHDTIAIDRGLTGVSMIDLLISRVDGNSIDFGEALEPLDRFEKEIRSFPRVRHCLGPVDFLKGSDATPFPGFPQGKPSPQAAENRFVSPNGKHLRIAVRAEAIGTKEGAELIERIQAAATIHLGEEFSVKPVGEFYRVVSESNQLVDSQIESFAVAISLIVASVGVVFRSIHYMLLAIIPNVIPLIGAAAIMGFFHIDLSTGTAMIASVVMGIAVDDTIHYLASFRRFRRSGLYSQAALKKTALSTGFALFSTTLALSLGFWVAVFGKFQPTSDFALLTGITMWLALACDLIVLPATLQIIRPKETKK